MWRGGWSVLTTPLLLLVVASSCGSGASEPDAWPTYDAWPEPDAYSGAIPGVVPAACRFHVPEVFGLTEGADYECGDLVVYENRDSATGRTIKVHYIRFISAASATDATVFLYGGPGYSGDTLLSEINDNIGTEFLNGLLVHGDFLIIAQRGTSLSVPALKSDDPSILSEFADLPSYNTAYNADDVDDLRSTLGYDQLNLWGASYGSRLGLEVMRRHGDRVRASVIDGLVPPDLNWFAAVPMNFYRAITALDDACADEGQCASAYGDLVAKLLAGLDSLNDQPLTFHEGLADEVTLDGYGFILLLFDVLYDNWVYPKLPMVISDVAERRTDRVGDIIVAMDDWAAIYFDDSDYAPGMYNSVVCGEQFNPPDELAYDEINADVPANLRGVFAGTWNWLLDTCGDWPVGPPRSELSQPVTSAVRTLVSSGTMDPITSASNGDLVASTLSNREVVVFPASGHFATSQSNCGIQTVLAFLADPDQSLDTSCTESLTIDFELPSKRKPWTAADQARLVSALRHAPIPPPIRERLARLRHR